MLTKSLPRRLTMGCLHEGKIPIQEIVIRNVVMLTLAPISDVGLNKMLLAHILGI